MTASTFGHTRVTDLTVSELIRIRMLNHSLSKAEYWIRQNATQLFDPSTITREACVANLRIEIRCVLHESDPHFDPEGENIVAKIDGHVILRATPVDHYQNHADTNEFAQHALSDMRVCSPFRELYEHGVQGDWDALSRIGEVSVEMWRPEQPVQGGGAACGN